MRRYVETIRELASTIRAEAAAAKVVDPNVEPDIDADIDAIDDPDTNKDAKKQIKAEKVEPAKVIDPNLTDDPDATIDAEDDPDANDEVTERFVAALIEDGQLDEGSKEEYQKFFKEKLEKFGVKSPSALNDSDKKKFFDEIKKEWKK